MKKGEVIEISFTGKEKTTQKIFETTDEAKAKEAGIYSEKTVYSPAVVVVGQGQLIKGLDETLLEMSVNERKLVEIPPEKGFGERKPELVRLLPLQEFKKRKMMPVPGMVIEANDRLGRVQSVSGGRVRVDFNHDLAGKTLEYEVKVERQLIKPEEKAEGLMRKYLPFLKEKPEIKLAQDVLEVSLPGQIAQALAPFKQAYAKTVLEVVDEIKRVKFIEEFNAVSFMKK